MVFARGRLNGMLACAILLFSLALAALPQVGHAQTEQRCFAETSFCISGRIREFWEQTVVCPCSATQLVRSRKN